MHKYIGHTEQDIQSMLDVIGIQTVDELFADIPEGIRKKSYSLPQPHSELTLMKKMKTLGRKNRSMGEVINFLGAGAYDHYIPSVVDALVSRQEFYTAYTPYQPEISQGTLQAIFEYQSMICTLTGMDVANASMYDGATAVAEAMNMACSVKKRTGVLLASSVQPETKEVVKTYGRFSKKNVTEIAMRNGQVDLELLKAYLIEDNGARDIGAVIVESPNFYGTIEDIKAISDLVHETKAQLIVMVDPISLGLLETPGKLGADIVVGEGQVLGNSLNFGGPYVGFLATTKKLMRKMPGRLVGETRDVDGKRAFVLTIQTREQHIRRDKATSNICSNQALNALMATIYMATMGKEGLKEVAGLCVQKAHYAYEQLINTGYFEKVYDQPFFKEFTLKYNGDSKGLRDYLLSKDIIFGYDLGNVDVSMKNHILIAVTEKRTKEEIDYVVELIREYSSFGGGFSG